MDVVFQIAQDRFIWNAEKAEQNFIKHGVRFEEACEILLDPFAVLIDASADGEKRLAALGSTQNNKHLYVVHVATDLNFLRIVSGRKMTPKERRIYENAA